MRQAGHVAHMGWSGSMQGSGGKARRKETREKDVSSRTILKWILEKMRMVWNGFIWLRIGTSRKPLLTPY
jgi:hypothetical protein